MSVSTFKDLAGHVGHAIECVFYGPSLKDASGVALECTTCNVVLIDFNRDGEEDEAAST